ncbi:hypothetical protein F2Q70_00041624 [Brassica cretica]|uniref:TIR domain-containing protein n=1 Tax=Brassica cretica TaxID=69181 RepID=A0A8S9K9F7_BRACR|nr:hypothetical protein F2Q70_00041624 [Brassica cretica]
MYIYTYQRYKDTKTLFLPKDNASNVYPKLCQSTTNAARLHELAHLTATSVGTEGGFCRNNNSLLSYVRKAKKGDSKFCLDEVVAILKCKEEFGQIVIPVLYHVDPVDIENQTGSFGEGFAKRRDKNEQLKEWKDGFTEAINLPGWSTSHFRDEEMLVNSIALDIESKLLRASRTKVIIEWSLVITNLMLEIPSCVLDQISSTNKPLYTLAAMSMSLLSCLLCLVDLLHKGRVERVVWKWSWPIPWFHYPTQRPNRFGSFPDMVGLVCALCQTFLTAINYSFITHTDDSPIKFSVWPILFALGLLCALFIKRSS